MPREDTPRCPIVRRVPIGTGTPGRRFAQWGVLGSLGLKGASEAGRLVRVPGYHTKGLSAAHQRRRNEATEVHRSAVTLESVANFSLYSSNGRRQSSRHPRQHPSEVVPTLVVILIQLPSLYQMIAFFSSHRCPCGRKRNPSISPRSRSHLFLAFFSQFFPIAVASLRPHCFHLNRYALIVSLPTLLILPAVKCECWIVIGGRTNPRTKKPLTRV